MDVEDPDTHAPLGTVRHTRLRLEIVTLQAKLSVGRVIDYVATPNAFVILSEKRKLVRVSEYGSSSEDEVHIEIGEPVIIWTPRNK